MAKPTEPDGLRAKKKERTRQAILDAALDLFIKQGFDETTVEQIAQAADVAPRTFFRYFTSKEDAVFLGQDAENEQLAALLRGGPASEAPLDALVRSLRVVLTQARPGMAAAQRHLKLMQRTPALRAHQAELMSSQLDALMGAFVTRKTPRAEALRLRMMLAAFMAAWSAVSADWIATGGKGELTDQLERVADLVRHGFQR